ncbi:MAG TPA: PAS domain S-box protein, partial [Usitatibacter sp.]|nr:PAS domain S-box protein [Usitatibacter sp.]
MHSLIPSLRRALGRLGEPHVLFPLIALVLLGVIWGSTLHVIQLERSVAEKAAASSSLEHADTYEAQVVRALREIDQTLRFIQFAHQSNAGRIDLAALKDKGLLLPDLLFVVSITDADGNVVATTRGTPSGSVAGLDYFQRLQASDVIAISRPQLSAEIESKLHFARRLSARDGSFTGIAIVTVGAAYFVSGYEPSRLGQRGFLGILGADGVFRARRIGETVITGEATDYGSVVRPDTAQPPEATVSRWDGLHRYTVARELFDFPVAVVVGLARDEQLAPVEERARAHLWRALGGSLLLVLFLGGLGRSSWQLQQTRVRANRALQDEITVRRQAEAALNLRNRAIESSVNAILIFDLSKAGHPIEYVNPAFERITGYTELEALGRDTGFLLGTDRDQPGVQEIQLALRERRGGHAVLRNYRKDGTLFWNEYSIAPVRDDTGEVRHFVGVMNDVTEAK